MTSREQNPVLGLDSENEYLIISLRDEEVFAIWGWNGAYDGMFERRRGLRW